MKTVGDRDIHILRYFSSFVSVADGEVIHVTQPTLTHCPLASHFYKDLSGGVGIDREAAKASIARIISDKIAAYGFFTPRRKFLQEETSVPCGASEMIAATMARGAVDAAVVVCDGAGTVVADNSRAVQGIGARMNSLVLTSPIKETMERLKSLGCRIVFEHALIDQVQGIRRAVEAGYKNIAVTVSGNDADRLEAIRRLETDKVKITILVVCTTGVSREKIRQMRRHADLVWSCASADVRQEIGSAALLQISKQIPVFVLTRCGADFFAGAVRESSSLKQIGGGRQYLISHEPGGDQVRFGGLKWFLRQEKLPVLTSKSLVGVISGQAEV